MTSLERCKSSARNKQKKKRFQSQSNLLTDSFAVDRHRDGLCADGIANVAAKAGAVERSEIEQN